MTHLSKRHILIILLALTLCPMGIWAQAQVTPGQPAPLYNDISTHAVSRNTDTDQMLVELQNGEVKAYDTASLEAVDVDKERSVVTITPKSGSPDVYYGTVRHISFAKAATADEPVITNHGVTITEAQGWLESACVKWMPYEGAQSYAVYVKGGQYDSYTKIDQMLVRDYGSYGRADMVGLRADTHYAFKVVPIVNDSEVETLASTAEQISVSHYSREGFAHKDYMGVGAYNDDGTLKAGAKVLYVTKNTAKTITCNVVTSSKGDVTTCKGIQAIISAYEKGFDTTPLAFRFIGMVEKADLDAIGSSEEGLQVKGRNDYSEMNITFEGIGDDATLRGFGFLVRNSKSVEFRNLAILRCMDDGISLDTHNSHVWIHHIDMFYGTHGSGDHAKGDGAIDVKTDSKYVSVSYCHYWDTGKTNMLGMKSESGPNYISYDHNWFDHSDSRHPRVRTMSVHVWNNFFDNVAKYGVGATSGSSVFVENNFFLNTKKPILSSLQGTDAQGSGTFSGEDGGMIKAYGNHFDRSAKNFKYYTQNTPASTGYDAYETLTRDEQVPATEVTAAGGHAYDNFDTDPALMYAYTAAAADDVPAIVTGRYGAGRMNHGDIAYTFADNVGSDNDDSAYDTALGALIEGYKSALVGIFGGESISGEQPGDNPGDDPEDPHGSTIASDVECVFTGGAPSSDLFDITGNYSNSKGSAVVNGQTLTWCLKLESSTSVKFTLEQPMTISLVFGSQDSKYTIKVDGAKKTGAQDPNVDTKQGLLTLTLEAGEHVLTKADTGNLFFIGLAF